MLNFVLQINAENKIVNLESTKSLPPPHPRNSPLEQHFPGGTRGYHLSTSMCGLTDVPVAYCLDQEEFAHSSGLRQNEGGQFSANYN